MLQRAMDRAEHSSGPAAIAVRYLPLVAALLVTAVGVVMGIRAINQM
jgi:hypothetical protein